jgi:LCP family protein required for cell wall assembly
VISVLAEAGTDRIPPLGHPDADEVTRVLTRPVFLDGGARRRRVLARAPGGRHLGGCGRAVAVLPWRRGRPGGRRRRGHRPVPTVAQAHPGAGRPARPRLSDKVTLEQRSRDAGRNAEIATVSALFGGLPIDHFVEVTMVAFYQLAQVVAPITVCVNEDTRDSYSGADFHRGYQQIDAAQAVAFVRQRRDTAHPQLQFTDLDRERRQQAFIASLAYQLRQAGTLSDPTRPGWPG